MLYAHMPDRNSTPGFLPVKKPNVPRFLHDRASTAPPRRVMPPAVRTHVALLSEGLARLIPPFSPVYPSFEDWRDSVAACIDGMNPKWLVSGQAAIDAIIGLVRLVRLGDAVHALEPFSRAASDIVDGALGDGFDSSDDHGIEERDLAATRGGLRPELIGFCLPFYEDVLASAGFRTSLCSAVPHDPEDFNTYGKDYYSQCWQWWAGFERRIRRFAHTALSDAFRDRWMADAMRERWESRRKQVRGAGQAIEIPIHYATPEELLDIICHQQCWTDVFQGVFQDRTALQRSFRRLQPVRDAFTRRRRVGRADMLILYSESTRMEKAMEAATW